MRAKYIRLKEEAKNCKLPDSVILENSVCPMGCQANDIEVLIGRDLINNVSGFFHVVKCKSCGILRTNPRPTAATIGCYYPPDYGPYVTSMASSDAEDRLVPPRSIKQKVVYCLGKDARALPDIQPGRVLEIGCASGSYLKVLEGKGWHAAGIEYSKEAAENARQLGFDVYCGAVETAPTPKEKYKMIVGWMVFEHLHDPAMALRRFHSWAEEDGWLVLSVPSNDWLERVFFREYSYCLQVPTHLYHFSPNTIIKLLHKNGWKVRKLMWHRNSRNFFFGMKNIMNSIGWHTQAKWFQAIADGEKHKKLRFLAGVVLGILRQSGRITIWAQRV